MKVKKPTAEKLKSILNGIFSYALSKEDIKHNIIKYIELKQLFPNLARNHYPHTIDIKEIKIYFDEVKDLSNRSIVKGVIKTIWLTALRQGSVRAIKQKHIDFDNKVLFIPRDNLKIKAVDFKIPLTDEIIKTFREIEKIKVNDYVFYSSNNHKKPISETSLRIFQKDIAKNWRKTGELLIKN